MSKKFKYAIIKPNEDGEFINFYTEKELIEFLDEFKEYREDCQPIFLKEIPENNPNYWKENEVLILKVETVVPKKVEVVTRYGI